MSPTLSLQDVALRSEITNDDVNDVNADLEAALNGPSIGGTGIEQVNLAAGVPVVVASSLSGLGPVRQGKLGMLKIASFGQTDYRTLVYDATLAKWVSEQVGQLTQQAQDTTTSATYVQLTVIQLQMLALPNFRAHYDAGLRLQVHVTALLDNSGANDSFLRASLLGFSNLDTALTASFQNGGEVVNNGTTGRYQTSGWVPMSAGAPTKEHAYLVGEHKRGAAGTCTTMDTSIRCRWVSA